MAITYVGAWRAGMDAHFLWQDADWSSFTAKWSELSGEGLRLARITTFLDGGQRRGTGVWREGCGGKYLWARRGPAPMATISRSASIGTASSRNGKSWRRTVFSWSISPPM